MNTQQQFTDAVKAEMELYEAALATLTPKEIVALLEELTVELVISGGMTGDYERQMRVKRVIIRKLSTGGDQKC